MASAVFIGDPVTATGYRLAGTRVHTPQAAGAAEALRVALADAPAFILLGATHARAIPAELLESVLLAFDPPVMVVPDAAGTETVPDWGTEIRTRILSE